MSHKIPVRRCSRCQNCYYCSQECQRSDFPCHKFLCKQFSTQPVRPSTKHKRAIFFPADKLKPGVSWVVCRREIDEDGVSWTAVDAYHYLKTDNPIKGRLCIEYNPIRKRSLGSGLAEWVPFNEGYCASLIHRDGYLIDGSANNKSIPVSVGASGPIPHEYRGPVIAIRELPHELYADIVPGDFRHLIDYVVSCHSTHIRESLQSTNIRAPTAIRGVKICCYGEIKLRGRRLSFLLNLTELRGLHSEAGLYHQFLPIFACLSCSANIQTSSSGLTLRGWPEGAITAASNPNVAILLMQTDPSRPEWG